MNIREYIKSNFKEDSIQSIRDSIVDSINKKEEVTLPGLGVFFEILWNASDQEHQEYILTTIKKAL